jgi:hypothetical protein
MHLGLSLFDTDQLNVNARLVLIVSWKSSVAELTFVHNQTCYIIWQKYLQSIEQHTPNKVPGMNAGVPEEWAFPAELVAPFMLC